VCEELVRAGVTHAVTVPDFVQFSVHQRLATGRDGIRQVFACSEDQALTTAAGLYVGGAKPVVMVQNQGLYKAMNTLRAVCIDARVPVVLMVGQFGREQENFQQPMRQSRRNMVRLLEPALDTFGIPHWVVDTDADVSALRSAFDASWTRKTAAALVFGRCTTWS
jgi:sulfopyruvate decarboxylase TPP-binding subunit